jgi:branched-subunit amino acid ABC-type transport system permease component
MHTLFIGISFGLVTAGVLALSTMALTLQYSVSKVVNFAHGDVMAVGAYAGLELKNSTHNVVLELVAAAIFGSATAFLIYRFLLRPFQRRNVPRLTLIVLTLAASLIIEGLLLAFFTGTARPYYLSPGRPVHLGPFLFTPRDLITISGAALAMAGCHVLLKYTRFGKALRAVSDNESLAHASGVAANKIAVGAWLIGGALTGIAGLVLGLSVGTLTPTLGFNFLFVVLAAAVVGGIGRPYGAMLGALLVGLAIEISGLYIASDYTQVVAFAILIVVLLVKPAGILGRATERAR